MARLQDESTYDRLRSSRRGSKLPFKSLYKALSCSLTRLSGCMPHLSPLLGNVRAMTLPQELLSFAETLADKAGEVIRSYWRQPVAVESKHEPGRPVAESPVTLADRAAEKVMRELIEAQCAIDESETIVMLPYRRYSSAMTITCYAIIPACYNYNYKYNSYYSSIPISMEDSIGGGWYALVAVVCRFSARRVLSKEIPRCEASEWRSGGILSAR